MSPVASMSDTFPSGFPRVSGDEPVDKGRGIVCPAFSPRERG